jgi:hypothetical protein
MQAGRNDPCPCGSGKKYKKCCYGKDQAPTGWVKAPGILTSGTDAPSANASVKETLRTALGLPEARASEPAPPEAPRDPILERADRIWEDFKARDTEGKVVLFLETLDDQEVMNGEMAYSLLAPLREDMTQEGCRARVFSLIDALENECPSAYEEEAHTFLHWKLVDAFAEGRRDELPAIARELAKRANSQFETFHQVQQFLQYHGLLSALLECLRVAWPVVKDSSEIFSFALSNVMNVAADMEIFAYLEEAKAPEADDPVLLERIHHFVAEPRMDYIRKFIADLTKAPDQEWKLEDLTPTATPKKRRRPDDEDEEDSEAEGADNLSRLISQFVGYLRREEEVPYARGELIRHELANYLRGRPKGRFNPRPGMLELALNPHKKLPKPPKPRHPLCPDRVTLEICLVGMMDMFGDQRYTAAALFETMPAWLRFLESRRLIDAHVREQVVKELLPLLGSLEKYWEGYLDDLTPYRRVLAWGQDAARGL